MEWNIKARSEVCMATQRPFAEDESFYTYLVETPQGLERYDLSEEAWNARNDNVLPLCFWKSLFKPAPPAHTEAVAKEDAESELRRLIESSDPADHKVCYLLALMLERKRILKVRERVRLSGEKKVIYEHTKTQEPFIVPEIDVKLSDIDQLREELSSSTGHIFSKKIVEVEVPAEAPAIGGEAPEDQPAEATA